MNPILIFSLLIPAAILMILESRGVNTSLNLEKKRMGDIKREARFLAQYGQFTCVAIVALLMWQIDSGNRIRVVQMIAATLGTSFFCTIIKRLLGRVRPNRENAGKFLGPTLKHANFRESFPSSHSACAVAMSVALASFYPAGAATFWTLGVICAALRYMLDAHWPSDCLAGIALGYIGAKLALMYVHG